MISVNHSMMVYFIYLFN